MTACIDPSKDLVPDSQHGARTFVRAENSCDGREAIQGSGCGVLAVTMPLTCAVAWTARLGLITVDPAASGRLSGELPGVAFSRSG